MKDRKHMARVAALGCIICGAPATVHHLTGPKYRGMGQKADDRNTIPLCPPHHQNGGHGVAIHAGLKAFEAKFGTQDELLAKTNRLLGIETNESNNNE